MAPGEGPPRLTPEEARHASTVLRLRPGDTILGLDGRGKAWPLRIEKVQRTSVEVAEDGPPESYPAPGAPGAATREVRLAFSMPTGSHLDGLIDRLTQIGVARFVPFIAARTPVRSRTSKPNLEQRLMRIARSACKQSRRLWQPEIEPLRSLAEVLVDCQSDRCTFLDPDAGLTLADWCVATPPNRAGEPARTITLFAGPEGGFAPQEIEAFVSSLPPVQPAWLGPHILRIETATEAAAAIALQYCTHRRRD
ncbi:MAG: 16S rRNA (uracil1498-N3)-methyltransferase [Chlamydiales bacterium]